MRIENKTITRKNGINNSHSSLELTAVLSGRNLVTNSERLLEKPLHSALQYPMSLVIATGHTEIV